MGNGRPLVDCGIHLWSFLSLNRPSPEFLRHKILLYLFPNHLTFNCFAKSGSTGEGILKSTSDPPLLHDVSSVTEIPSWVLESDNLSFCYSRKHGKCFCFLPSCSSSEWERLEPTIRHPSSALSRKECLPGSSGICLNLIM